MISPPSVLSGTLRVGRLHLTRLVRGNRIWLTAIAVALVDIAAISTHFIMPEMDVMRVYDTTVRYGFFLLLVFLVPFLLVTGIIAEEVEGRTLPFLLVRPISRSSLALGKFSAAMLVAVGFLTAGLLILHVSLFLTDPTMFVDTFPDTARIMGALSLLAILYGSVCGFWGALLPEGATVVSAVFLGFFEFFFSRLPSTFRFISMNHWAQDIAGLERGGFMPESVPPVDLWIAFLPITGELVIFLGAMVLVVSQSEFRFGKA